jgi:hypothetical protein
MSPGGHTTDRCPDAAGFGTEVVVVILGIILLIVGLIASLSILVWLGVLLLVVGLVLNLVPIGGTRRRYY